jgi:hypothetical protein
MPGSSTTPGRASARKYRARHVAFRDSDHHLLLAGFYRRTRIREFCRTPSRAEIGAF